MHIRLQTTHGERLLGMALSKLRHLTNSQNPDGLNQPKLAQKTGNQGVFQTPHEGLNSSNSTSQSIEASAMTKLCLDCFLRLSSLVLTWCQHNPTMSDTSVGVLSWPNGGEQGAVRLMIRVRYSTNILPSGKPYRQYEEYVCRL